MERIPVEAVVEGKRVVLGFMQVISEIKTPGIADSTDFMVDFGSRKFRATLTGAPWNVFVMKEEIF